MANKQPMYHVASVLITATRTIPESEIEAQLIKLSDVVSVQVESLEVDAGDPADLIG